MIPIQEFTAKDASDLANQWLVVYGVNRADVDARDFLWHVFSYERFPAVSGKGAIEAYRRQECCEFVVLSNDRKTAYLLSRRPDDRPFPDFLVFPPNLAWTMAFTHEDGCHGPYFAMHPRYNEVNIVNLAKVEKMREVAHAKSQGWL